MKALMLWTLSVLLGVLVPQAHAQTPIPIVIGGLGQSNMLGYADPYPCVLNPTDPTCDDVPVGATYVRNGVIKTEFVDNYSGVEVSLLHCLVDSGWAPTMYVRAINGMAARTMNTTHVPLLIQDFEAAEDAGLPAPAAVVVIHGEQDSKLWYTAEVYRDRIFGPAYETTGPRGYLDTATNLWVQPVDESTVGQVRGVFPFVPFIVTELRTVSMQDLVFGAVGNSGYLHHGAVREAQAYCEGGVPGCFYLKTGPQYPVGLAANGSVINDTHYNAEGYDKLGKDLCEVIKSWAVVSFPQ